MGLAWSWKRGWHGWGAWSGVKGDMMNLMTGFHPKEGKIYGLGRVDTCKMGLYSILGLNWIHLQEFQFFKLQFLFHFVLHCRWNTHLRAFLSTPNSEHWQCGYTEQFWNIGRTFPNSVRSATTKAMSQRSWLKNSI